MVDFQGLLCDPFDIVLWSLAFLLILCGVYTGILISWFLKAASLDDMRDK